MASLRLSTYYSKATQVVCCFFSFSSNITVVGTGFQITCVTRASLKYVSGGGGVFALKNHGKAYYEAA